jgi:hypothetical protein
MELGIRLSSFKTSEFREGGLNLPNHPPRYARDYMHEKATFLGYIMLQLFWLHFMAHVKLFYMTNFCTCTSVLYEVIAYCQVWLFSVVP